MLVSAKRGEASRIVSQRACVTYRCTICAVHCSMLAQALR